MFFSGKYSDDPVGNMAIADEWSLRFAENGWGTYTPHKNHFGFEQSDKISYEYLMEVNIEVLKRCDAVCMLPGWEESAGARREYQIAIDNDIPIYYADDCLGDVPSPGA